MNKWIYYSVIAVIAMTVFFGSNHFLRGYLGSMERLGKELQSPKDSLYQYKLIEKAPFKYRILFPALIKSSFELLCNEDNSAGFFYVYKYWSLFFFFTSGCLLFYLLQLNGFSSGLSLFGVSLFLLLPAALMAYTVPVHTREDPMAYSILFLGLIFLINKNSWYFLVVSILGALCRETLLLLPMLYFFYSMDDKVLRKLFITGLPCLVWISLRILIEKTPYDTLEGFHWNNSNPEQVVGFLFLTYNLLWLPFLFYQLSKKSIILSTENQGRLFFFKSSSVTVIIILLTTYLGGIYNEIRLLYLASPWIIIISLDFFERRGSDILKLIRRPQYFLFAAMCVLAFIFLIYFLLKFQSVLIKPGRYKIPYHLWIVISSLYFMISIIFAPAFVRAFFKK